jgi:gliding motility-associated-like protein
MHMSVYNRWGELVFETDNKKDFWDGIYNNKRFDNNVYVWHAEYTGWDNSKHSLTGNVTVLK